MASTNMHTTTESDDDTTWCDHLNWSTKQARILTDGGNAMRYYSNENGFPFSPEELPHHHRERGDSHPVFRGWARERCEGRASREGGKPMLSLSNNGANASTTRSSPIIGAWVRTIFAGRWEHTTYEDEITYNVQTGTLFVDLRIPTTKPFGRWEETLKHAAVCDDRRRALTSLSDHELRLYARQHVFGGFTVLTTEGKRSGRPLATRHHCVDWNHIPGKPRPRPNKWYIECEDASAQPANRWKEWSYSTDDNGQCYYYEIWERIKGDEMGEGVRLAMRKCNGTDATSSSSSAVAAATCHDDGILVVVGDHFNYVLGRQWSGREKNYPDATNISDLVDSAIQNGDRETAISYLSLDGGHGTRSSGWKIDCSIQSWNHGMRVFDRIGGVEAQVRVVGRGADFFSWKVSIGTSHWEIYESSVVSAIELEVLLTETYSRSSL